ncbi:MAG TPA: iron ABC transporter permease [Acidimicrobiales bacterium]|jgi:iron complex transport system permease protein|nr:iron ABC transporter permease [Acidimicrobiales bacterium]
MTTLTVLPRANARRPLLVAAAALVGAMVVGMSVGPASIPLATVFQAFAGHIPFIGYHPHVSSIDWDVLWQIRAPRVVLGGLVGAMLAGGGAAYQGVFRNPLADPYLLGVAAGAGLGATLIIVAGSANLSQLLPFTAFAGAVLAVVMTYLVGASSTGGLARRSGSMTNTSIVLAGVAVAALFTAVQTYLQQQHSPELQNVYAWILGSLTIASWSQVRLILPYVIVSAVVLVAHRRLLDVLRVGEDEAGALGINTARVRLIVVAAATVGTAAVVSVSGLIGFVGIIVPHTVRLMSNASYRVVLPVSMVGGAAFLILADVVARTVESPAEIPIGVVTAFAGAPFFLFVLRSRRAQSGV